MTSREMQDHTVISGLMTAVTKEREAIAEVVQYLAQVDDKKLYLTQAYSSLFQYCVEKLHYSESAAYRRIHAARMVQKFPKVIGLLKQGKVHLTTLTLIAPHVTTENVVSRRVMSGFFGSSSLRSESPQNDEARFRRDVVLPMTDTQVKITFQAGTVFAQNLTRAKETLKHKYPQGKIEDILGEALECFLNHKDPLRKVAKTSSKPLTSAQATTRYIPQATRTTVWKRDNGQCTYCSSDGKRCGERGALELDHVKPFALGGTCDVQNLRLLCSSHNLWRAQQTFG